MRDTFRSAQCSHSARRGSTVLFEKEVFLPPRILCALQPYSAGDAGKSKNRLRGEVEIASAEIPAVLLHSTPSNVGYGHVLGSGSLIAAAHENWSVTRSRWGFQRSPPYGPRSYPLVEAGQFGDAARGADPMASGSHRIPTCSPRRITLLFSLCMPSHKLRVAPPCSLTGRPSVT